MPRLCRELNIDHPDQSLSPRVKRIAWPSRVILSHTIRFSSGLKKTQFETSKAVRPQPLQTSSKRVEHTPMQGLSGKS
jgi:hypothetical protein